MDDMLHSAEWNELAAALAKAQAAMDNAEKNSVNPHFRQKYADIAAVRSATIPHLAANGIALVQQFKREGAQLVIKTMLIHSSGQWIGSEFPVPPLQRVQEIGSYLTYGRRYSWMGLTGIAPEDDDGNEANAAKAAPQRKPRLVASPMVPRQEEPPEDYNQDPGPLPEDGPLPAGEGGAEDSGSPPAPPSTIEPVLTKAAGEGTDSLRTAWRNLTQAERAHWEQALYRRFLPMAKAVDEAMHGQGEATQN